MGLSQIELRAPKGPEDLNLISHQIVVKFLTKKT